MQTHHEFHTARAQPRHRIAAPVVAWTAPRSLPPMRDDQPRSEGLSQAELRRIVIDMIG